MGHHQLLHLADYICADSQSLVVHHNIVQAQGSSGCAEHLPLCRRCYHKAVLRTKMQRAIELACIKLQMTSKILDFALCVLLTWKAL